MGESNAKAHDNPLLSPWALLDALPDALAVVTTHNQLAFCNASWQSYQQQQPASGSPAQQTDFFEHMHAVFAPDEAAMQAIRRGLRALLQGNLEHFTLDYPAAGSLLPGTRTPRWLSLTATPYMLEHARGALVQQRDITSQKQAEQSLRDAQVRWQTIFTESLDILLVINSASGQIESVNPAVRRILGYRPADLIGQHFSVLFPLHDPEDESTLQQLRIHSGTFEGQPFRSASGSVVPLDLSTTIINWGSERAILVTLHDANERRTSEQAAEQAKLELYQRINEQSAALHTSQKLFQAILDYSPAVIYVKDLQGRLLIVNRQYARVLQRAPAQIIGKTDDELFDPAVAAIWEETHQQILATGRPIEKEDHLPLADGVHTYLSTLFPLFDMQGRLYAIGGIASDITDRKRAEDGLRSARERLQHLISSSPVIIFSSTAADDFGATFVSENIQPILGYTPQEFTARSDFWASHIHPEDAPRIFASLPALFERDEHFHEYRFLHKDSSYRWMQNQLRLIRNEAGEPVEIVGSLQDISDRKQAEDALRRSEARLDAFFTGAPAGMILLDENLRFRKVNPAAAEINGLPASAHIGKSILEVLPGLAELVPMYEGVLTSGQPILHREVSASHPTQPDATGYWQLSVFPVPGIDGSSSVGAIFVDVSERRRAELLLQEANEKLEQRVAMRTDQLLQINEDLHAEIEERWRTEEALRQSEERLRHIVEHMPVMLDAFDPDGLIVVWNTECERVTGYSAQEMIGNPRAMELLYPDTDYRALVLQEWAAYGHDYREWEWHLTAKDGSQKTIAWSNISEHFPIPGWASWGIGIDVTRRKQAEAALRQNEALYHTITRNIPNGSVLLFDHDLRYLLAEGSEDFDYSMLQDKTIWEALDAETASTIAPLYRAALAGQPTRFELPFLSRMYEVYTLPIRDETGNVLVGMVMTQDITERKQAEARQATQLAVTRILAEASSVDEAIPRVLRNICRGLDWQYGEMWRVDISTEVLRHTYCWYEPELEESDFVQRSPEITFARGEGLPGRVWESGHAAWVIDIVEAPYFVRAAEAASADLHGAFAFRVGMGEAVEGILCFFSHEPRALIPSSEMMLDLGSQVSQFLQRQHAEHALEAERVSLARRVAERTADLSFANAELARAVRTKDEFLANMSHELRTPLNAVLGMAEALQEGVYGKPNQAQLAALQTIEESGRHLLALINDILELSKIEAGKVDLTIDAVDIYELCQASLRLIKQEAYKKHITVAENLDQTVQTLYADERRLKQILVNLLSNAVKFTPERQMIGLEVTGDAARQVVHFSVWDTGIGIEREKMNQLFRPFVQIDGGLNRQHEGTGLGLALVSRLTEMHGGSVHVESEPDKGSRFTVSLPWLNPDTINAGQQSSLAAQPELSLSSLHRALLIEDSPTAADQVMRYLEDLHIAPEIIREGDRAIEQATALKPDVIILDILLPDISGWDVLGALKADPRTSHIPIVIVSNIDDQPRGLEMGAAAYLVKPISRQELQSALHKIIAPAPAAPPKALVLVPEPSEARTEQSPLILVAEDNEDNSTLLADYLQSKGYQVLIARNGNEAVITARERLPALILMDIQMPGMDGLEATRHIRANSDLQHIPIIALTALAMPGDRERCLEAGTNDYMSKPIQLKHLLQMIERLLRAVPE